MSGSRRWVAGAVLLVLSYSLQAQVPVGKPSAPAEPPNMEMPAGTVVGSMRAPAPVANVTILAPMSDPLLSTADTAPIPTIDPKPAESPLPTLPTVAAEAKAPLLPPPGPAFLPPPGIVGNDCCGPLGADGPIGQEVYLRYGWTYPQGEGRLAFNLEQGCMGQFGLRSQFFNVPGDAAWVVDAHIVYIYNDGVPNDIHTFRTEPVTVKALHRTAVGLGLGRDWFLAQPGFVLDTWDMNFRFGVDGGGRWGTGHVDFDTPFEPGGYRRHHDVFTQAFAGMQASAEMPVGGWTFLIGARGEWNYTSSKLIPIGANFHEIIGSLIFGVRY